MAYVTSAQVVSRIGSAKAAQLTAETGTTPDTTKIDAIIAEAEGVVNIKLATRYTVPIVQATFPVAWDFVVSCSMRMSVYHTYALRPPVPEDIRLAHDEALEQLTDIVNGDANLGDADLLSGGATWDSIAPTGDPYRRDLHSDL